MKHLPGADCLGPPAGVQTYLGMSDRLMSDLGEVYIPGAEGTPKVSTLMADIEQGTVNSACG